MLTIERRAIRQLQGPVLRMGLCLSQSAASPSPIEVRHDHTSSWKTHVTIDML